MLPASLLKLIILDREAVTWRLITTIYTTFHKHAVAWWVKATTNAFRF